jgi:hypothetical protein
VCRDIMNLGIADLGIWGFWNPAQAGKIYSNCDNS